MPIPKEIPPLQPAPEQRRTCLLEKWLALIAFLLVTVSAVALWHVK
jgi:hypothetical protein